MEDGAERAKHRGVSERASRGSIGHASFRQCGIIGQLSRHQTGSEYRSVPPAVAPPTTGFCFGGELEQFGLHLGSLSSSTIIMRNLEYNADEALGSYGGCAYRGIDPG